MFPAIAIAVVCVIIWAAPRLLVSAIATMIGVIMVARSRQVWRDLLEEGSVGMSLNYDRRPSPAARQAMRKGLRLAIAQTELRSLLPGTMARAERYADMFAR